MRDPIRGDRLDPVAVGERIRKRRRFLGMGQRELANETEQDGGTVVTYAYISRLESGARTPSFATLIALGRALHVTPEWLAYGNPLPEACIWCERPRRQRRPSGRKKP